MEYQFQNKKASEHMWNGTSALWEQCRMYYAIPTIQYVCMYNHDSIKLVKSIPDNMYFNRHSLAPTRYN